MAARDRDSGSGSASEHAEATPWLVVYGSLMRGLPAPGGTTEPGGAVDLLDRLGVGAKLRHVGPCRVAGELFDLGPYPAMRRTATATASIRGELHAILDAGVLEVLDAFEGYDPRDPDGSDYLREAVELQDPPGIRAWIYVYNRALEATPRVASGDWRRHLAERGLSAHAPDFPPPSTAAREPRPSDRRATTDEEKDRWDS